MAMRITHLSAALILTVLATGDGGAAEPVPPPNVYVAADGRVFDADPAHLWNRLHWALFARVSPDGFLWGVDRLDPLLWPDSTYLLKGDGHQRAVKVLDEFLDGHGERLVTDPVKRAVMQHDLWKVFDWAAADDSRRRLQKPGEPDPRRELRVRLARAMQRLALSAKEIAALPDTLAADIESKTFSPAFDPAAPERPFIPADLLDPKGPWLCLRAHSNPQESLAKIHTMDFSAHSLFLIFVRHAEGRVAGQAYLKALNEASAAQRIELSKLQLGSQVLLVRQMLLLDAEGILRPTALTESVQSRMINGPAPQADPPARNVVALGLFEMSRPKLFAAQAGGLRAIGPDNQEVKAPFRTHGRDVFEKPGKMFFKPDFDVPLLKKCAMCHHDAVNTAESLTLNFTSYRLDVRDAEPAYVREQLVRLKTGRFDFGVLLGILDGAEK